MDFSTLSVDELLDLSERVRREQKKRERSEIESARNEIYAIAHRMGLPLSKVMKSGSTRKFNNNVAVKYRNPSNPAQEWTGRGRRPRWLKEFVISGGDIQTVKHEK